MNKSAKIGTRKWSTGRVDSNQMFVSDSLWVGVIKHYDNFKYAYPHCQDALWPSSQTLFQMSYTMRRRSKECQNVKHLNIDAHQTCDGSHCLNTLYLYQGFDDMSISAKTYLPCETKCILMLFAISHGRGQWIAPHGLGNVCVIIAINI